MTAGPVLGETRAGARLRRRAKPERCATRVATATSSTVRAPPPPAMIRLFDIARRTVASDAIWCQLAAVSRCHGASSVVSACTLDIATLEAPWHLLTAEIGRAHV